MLVTIFILQLDAQAIEGLWISGIFFGSLFLLGLYSKLVWEPEEKQKKIEQIKTEKIKAETKSLKWEFFLNDLKQIAVDFNKNSPLANADRALKIILKKLESQIVICQKCKSDNFRIWELTNTLIRFRCNDCKKKYEFLNKDLQGDIVPKLKNAISLYIERCKHNNWDKPNVSMSTDFIKNHYEESEWLEQWHQQGLSNPHIRRLSITFDFDLLRANTPYYCAITLKPSLQEQTKTIIGKDKFKRTRRIPQKIKDDVWNRDKGRCVECGSKEKLEFDHIIPFSKGGANTYRNIQILCEYCNRVKSDKIG